MKLTILTLSALGLTFASTAVAQNGNDPVILNNRTGLDPVVYDTFSTSYTTSLVHEPASMTLLHGVTGSPVPVPVRSNTYVFKSTTSMQCWRNGYPCEQNGGGRSQRRVAEFVRATTVVDDAPMNILPIPTEMGGGQQDAAPTSLSEPAPAVEAREAGVPIDWWRGPNDSIVPDSPGRPIQRHSSLASHSSKPTISTLYLPAVPPQPTDGVPTNGQRLRFTTTPSDGTSTLATNDPCYHHYCPSWMSTLDPLPTPSSTFDETTLSTVFSRSPGVPATSFPAVSPEITTVVSTVVVTVG